MGEKRRGGDGDVFAVSIGEMEVNSVEAAPPGVGLIVAISSGTSVNQMQSA